MDRAGKWSLSPAFDITYVLYDPTGWWTSQHQIQMQGKQDNFTRDDLLEFAKVCGLTRRQGNTILDKVLDAFEGFERLARQYEVPTELTATVPANLRIKRLGA